MEPDIIEFLQHSNYIEGVSDSDSLDQAVKAWEYLIEQDVLTVKVILETHRILMLNTNLQSDERGFLRTCNVRVGIYYPPNYNFVPVLIHNWVFESMRKHPKVDAKALHIEFEKIHPFVDGNGRVGRMLYNWTRIKRNDEDLHIIREEDRQEYYQWFRK